MTQLSVWVPLSAALSRFERAFGNIDTAKRSLSLSLQEGLLSASARLIKGQLNDDGATSRKALSHQDIKHDENARARNVLVPISRVHWDKLRGKRRARLTYNWKHNMLSIAERAFLPPEEDATSRGFVAGMRMIAADVMVNEAEVIELLSRQSFRERWKLNCLTLKGRKPPVTLTEKQWKNVFAVFAKYVMRVSFKSILISGQLVAVVSRQNWHE